MPGAHDARVRGHEAIAPRRRRSPLRPTAWGCRSSAIRPSSTTSSTLPTLTKDLRAAAHLCAARYANAASTRTVCSPALGPAHPHRSARSPRLGRMARRLYPQAGALPLAARLRRQSQPDRQQSPPRSTRWAANSAPNARRLFLQPGCTGRDGAPPRGESGRSLASRLRHPEQRRPEPRLAPGPFREGDSRGRSQRLCRRLRRHRSGIAPPSRRFELQPEWAPR